MDLAKMLVDSLNEIEQSGKLKEIMDKHALQMVTECMRDMTKWDSPFKKAYEEELKTKLRFDPNRVNVAQYGDLLLQAVQAKTNEFMCESAKTTADNLVEEVLGKFQPKKNKYSFDDFMSEICSLQCYDHEDLYNDGDGFQKQMSVCADLVESDYGGQFWDIRFSEDKKVKTKSGYTYSFCLTAEGRIFHVRSADRKDTITQFLIAASFCRTEITDMEEMEEVRRYSVPENCVEY
jgi:hypothetical protein